jgi:hypothetical protein
VSDISERTRAFLARFDGIEVPDWATAADLSRMGMESMVQQEAIDAANRPVSAQNGAAGVDGWGGQGQDDTGRLA